MDSSPRNTGSFKALNAARAAPLPAEQKRLSKEQLKEGAVDTVLNTTSILRELAEDFRSSDRFFKYKIFVLLSWLALSVTSVGVACPTVKTNPHGAQLVIAGEAAQPIYMVKNDGEEVWEDVEVLVNGAFRFTAARVTQNGDLTLSPVMLIDENGKTAPRDLRITDIELRIAGGDPQPLLQGGQVPQ